MNVLITGGAGYIGSHCNRYFHVKGIHTVVLDDLSDGHEESVIFGKFIKGSFGDKDLVKEILAKEKLMQSFISLHLLPCRILLQDHPVIITIIYPIC